MASRGQLYIYEKITLILNGFFPSEKLFPYQFAHSVASLKTGLVHNKLLFVGNCTPRGWKMIRFLLLWALYSSFTTIFYYNGSIPFHRDSALIDCSEEVDGRAHPHRW